MKAEYYRSKKKYPGKVISIGRYNTGKWYIDGYETPLFDSVEEIEQFLDDELEMIVPQH